MLTALRSLCACLQLNEDKSFKAGIKEAVRDALLVLQVALIPSKSAKLGQLGLLDGKSAAANPFLQSLGDSKQLECCSIMTYFEGLVDENHIY